MSVTEEKPDHHAELADTLGITRNVAKLINLTTSYRTKSLVNDRGAAFSILRCYHIAAIWPGNWGAAKSAKWAWLTQDQPVDDRVAINVIKKFLPDPREIFEHHPLETALEVRLRLKKAREAINKATDETALPEIEQLLRPIAYLLENEGHSTWQ